MSNERQWHAWWSDQQRKSMEENGPIYETVDGKEVEVTMVTASRENPCLKPFPDMRYLGLVTKCLFGQGWTWGIGNDGKYERIHRQSRMDQIQGAYFHRT